MPYSPRRPRVRELPLCLWLMEILCTGRRWSAGAERLESEPGECRAGSGPVGFRTGDIWAGAQRAVDGAPDLTCRSSQSKGSSGRADLPPAGCTVSVGDCTLLWDYLIKVGLPRRPGLSTGACGHPGRRAQQQVLSEC